MLLDGLWYSGPEAKSEERGGVREHNDTQRSMSAVWLKVVQAKRAHSYGETESSLQNVWSGLRVEARKYSVITEKQRALIERLLLERISLRGIYRALGVGLRSGSCNL